MPHFGCFGPVAHRALLALASIACALPAGAVTFSDATFNLAGYSIAGPTTSGANVTVEQCAACGPGADAALRIAAEYPTDVGNYRVALLNTAWVFDPSAQGQIVAIDAATDKRVLLSFNIANGSGNSFRPLLQQGGQYYAALLAGPTIFFADEGWKFISGSGLTASSFTVYDFTTGIFGSANPDFVAGGPITFGLLQLGNRSGLFPSSTVEVDYDNLVLTITSVPEPRSAALLLAGLLAGLLAVRGLMRRRR